MSSFFPVYLQLQVLESIEGHNDQVREDLEQHIASIQRSITGYETSYNANMQVLGTMSESLMSILRNVRQVVKVLMPFDIEFPLQVASDEDAVDQQLLSSGLNDRNIETYLGIVEQRIDYLIQAWVVFHKLRIINALDIASDVTSCLERAIPRLRLRYIINKRKEIRSFAYPQLAIARNRRPR